MYTPIREKGGKIGDAPGLQAEGRRDESGGGIIKGGKDRTWKFELVNTRREREKPREGDRLYNYAI